MDFYCQDESLVRVMNVRNGLCSVTLQAVTTCGLAVVFEMHQGCDASHP